MTVIDPDELRLTAVRITGNQVQLFWPATGGTPVLQEATSLAADATWNVVSSPRNLLDGTWSVTLPAASGARFYRLR